MTQKQGRLNYYEILEVSPKAPQHEIQVAYRRVKETYSSDSAALYSMFTPEEARDFVILIEEAYSTLGDMNRRRSYDESLSPSKRPQQVSVERSSQDQTNALPDLEPMDLSGSRSHPASVPVNRSHPKGNVGSAKSVTLPEGFARTKFGVYEIDDGFEAEIKTQTIFDGTFLQRVRLYKNINLDHLSQETRISRNYLAAIEANDFDGLPAPVFVRGFVTQTARVLGLNEQLVANSFVEVYKKGSVD